MNDWMHCSFAPKRIQAAAWSETAVILPAAMLSAYAYLWDRSTHLQQGTVPNRAILSTGTSEIAQSHKAP